MYKSEEYANVYETSHSLPNTQLQSCEYRSNRDIIV